MAVQKTSKANIIVCAVSVGILAIIVAAYGLSPKQATSHSTGATQPTPMTTLQANARISELAAEYWQWELDNFPEFASAKGEPEGAGSLTNMSLAALAERQQYRLDLKANLDALSTAPATGEDAITLQTLNTVISTEIRSYQFNEHLVGPFGLPYSLLRLQNLVPMGKASEVANYVSRLRAMPTFIDQCIQLLKTGVEINVTAPRVIVPITGPQIISLCSAPSTIAGSPLLAALQPHVGTTNQAINASLTAAEQIVATQVTPAFCRLADYWTTTYAPATSPLTSASARFGPAYYAHCITRYTTTNLTAQFLHDLGLRQVALLQTRMTAVQTLLGFNASVNLSTVNDMMRSNPQYLLDSEDKYLMYVRAICKRTDALLPKLFAVLPRCTYGVEPYPPSIAPSAGFASYDDAAENCTRPGIFNVNVYNVQTLPTFLATSTAMHESVPGHHLQIALALEMTGLPMFRRFPLFSVFSEGWALYAETLGAELNMYANPADEFGFLGNEMLRACRLVVDTGMNALGWTADAAAQFMRENSPLRERDIQSEILRYILAPGQALAYKVGSLTIQGLRQAATQALGDAFDLKTFHSAVLEHGAIPLAVLSNAVQQKLGFVLATDPLMA